MYLCNPFIYPPSQSGGSGLFYSGQSLGIVTMFIPLKFCGYTKDRKVAKFELNPRIITVFNPSLPRSYNRKIALEPLLVWIIDQIFDQVLKIFVNSDLITYLD
uniref:Uncharacterized protein n=1 Tax=Rhizophagus irregularis (strain DAOM 181602 / DAOM 197198 / MUCL 43194) TaxID=747089 RepID=U9UNY6_RHIID